MTSNEMSRRCGDVVIVLGDVDAIQWDSRGSRSLR